MEILIILAIFMVAMMFFSSRGRKKQENQIREMHEQIEPGVWVRTTAGFYGIVSDVDGDVYILQTPNGEESYWDRRAIATVAEPPFENYDDDAFEDSVPESTDADVIDETEANDEAEPVVEDDENFEPDSDQAGDSADAPVEEDPEDLWDDTFAPKDQKSDDDTKN